MKIELRPFGGYRREVSTELQRFGIQPEVEPLLGAVGELEIVIHGEIFQHEGLIAIVVHFLKRRDLERFVPDDDGDSPWFTEYNMMRKKLLYFHTCALD